MTAVELTRALERCEVPDGGFPHASHVRVAWVYLEESASVDEAAARMAATLRRFAASVGQAEKYHETMTRFWMRRLAGARAAHPDASLDEILAGDPSLLDKNLTREFYSPGRLDTDEARSAWVEPDRRPL